MELAGVTGRCRTLPRSLDLQNVIDVIPEARGRAVLLQDNLRQAEAQGKLELAAAMREGASKELRTHPVWTRPFRRLRKVVRDAPKRRRRKQTRRALQAHLRATGGEHLFVSVPAADPAGGQPSR
jgi:hypothetical protein